MTTGHTTYPMTTLLKWPTITLVGLVFEKMMSRFYSYSYGCDKTIYTISLYKMAFGLEDKKIKWDIKYPIQI